MVAVLDSVGERIAPHDILQRVGSASKEDSLLGVLDVLRLVLPGQDLDPQMTPKCSKQSEIVLLTVQFLVSRLRSIASW